MISLPILFYPYRYLLKLSLKLLVLRLVLAGLFLQILDSIPGVGEGDLEVSVYNSTTRT